MTVAPNKHEHMSAGGASGVLATAYGAAESLRRQAPVRVNSVREQERRLTGAGTRNPFQSVPVSFEFRLRGDTSTRAHRRRAVALLPEQLVAAISPAGRRCERSSCVPLFRRRNSEAFGRISRQARTDLTPSIFHSTGLLSRVSLRPNRSDDRRPKSWKSLPARNAA